MKKYDEIYTSRPIIPSRAVARGCFLAGLKREVILRSEYARELRKHVKQEQRLYSFREWQLRQEYDATPECEREHDEFWVVLWKDKELEPLMRSAGCWAEYRRQYRVESRHIHLAYGLAKGRRFDELERGKTFGGNPRDQAVLDSLATSVHEALERFERGLGHGVAPTMEEVRAWLLRPSVEVELPVLEAALAA